MPLTDIAPGSSCPQFYSKKKDIKAQHYTMVCGFLGLNWSVSFLFCLLTHFLKSNLSLLLSFSLRQYISSAHNTHRSSKKRGGSKRGKIFITFTREKYKLLFSDGRQGGMTVDRTAMEQTAYFFQREPYLLLQPPRTSHINTIEIMTWIHGVFINSLL